MSRESTLASVRCWKYIDLPEDRSLCWNWTGATTYYGYGVINSGGQRGKLIRAHRLLWEMHNGPIPEGKNVLHSCEDNTRCVNPAHLRVGDQKENAKDMISQGRARGGQPAGEDHPRGLLTDSDMRAIQEEYAESNTSYSKLAEKYGCSKKTAMNVVSGKCRIGGLQKNT